jgi:hypothetical protein
MPHLKLEERDKGEPWDGYPPGAWKRDSLAVIACNGRGEGCVLFTAGPHVRLELEEHSMATLSDLGLDDAPGGISVWVGRYVFFNTSHPLGPDEGYVSEPRGSFRAPTDAEWAAIRKGENPWNDADWREE